MRHVQGARGSAGRSEAGEAVREVEGSLRGPPVCSTEKVPCSVAQTASGRVNTGEGVGEAAREVGSPFDEPCHPLSGDWLHSELDMGLL